MDNSSKNELDLGAEDRLSAARRRRLVQAMDRLGAKPFIILKC